MGAISLVNVTGLPAESPVLAGSAAITAPETASSTPIATWNLLRINLLQTMDRSFSFVRTLPGLCHLGHQLQKNFALPRAERLEHGAAHCEPALQKRLVKMLSFFGESHLNDSAIFIHAR